MASPRSKKQQTPPDPLHEVVVGKLYTVNSDELKYDHLEQVTALVDLSGDPELIDDRERYLYISWTTSDDVDEGQFEGVVRFCSSVMKSKGQRVLVVGHQDVVDTVATCVLREFVGCDAQTALDVMRQHRQNSMTKSELVETVLKYKPS